MTTYTLAAGTSWTMRNLGSARTGGDVYNINGSTFTIDQDTRYGQGGATTYAHGAMTISATLGGTLNIDGRYVKLIPYNTGSGTITAGTTITVGSGTGIVIGLYSAINVAPVLTGVATGFIKVTAWNSVDFPTSGTYTQAGFTFTVTGAATTGFIEINGDESATCTVPRLGTLNITGEWFYTTATTSGSSATTYQLPTNGSVMYYPGVQVETGVGTGIYEWYPCAGSLVAASSIPTDAVRGKVCWVSTGGVLRLGSDGTNTVGYVPVSGCKIRIPNIIFQNNTTAARGTNALPNATLATRYDFTTTGGGVVNISKACMAWYLSFAQAYSVDLSDVGTLEQISISEVAAPMTWSKVCVGQAAAQAQFALLKSLCFAGGTFNDCTFTCASLAASGRYVTSVVDVDGFTYTNLKAFSFVHRANNTTGNMLGTRIANSSFISPVIGSGQHILTTCSNVSYTDIVYYDTNTTTGTTYPMSVVYCLTNSQDITISGITFGGLTNVQPYSALVSMTAAGCKNIKLRNVGSNSAKLSLGSVNNTAYVLSLGTGAAVNSVELKRVYCSNTRTNFLTGDNSSKNIRIYDCSGDYADAPVFPMLNGVQLNCQFTAPLTAQTACYGTHWVTQHVSATVGRLCILMNEATAETSSYITLSSGAAFTSAGSLYMPVIGQYCTFETPDWIIGYTSFQNSPAIMAGGTATNYTYAYQINTGSGYSAWSSEYTPTTLATALNGLGSFTSTGFKLKIRITTSVTNATAITSLYLLTNSTTTTQGYQYPLDTATLTITNVPENTEIRVRQGSFTLDQKQDVTGGTYTYAYEATSRNARVQFTLPGYVFEDLDIVLSPSGVSVPVVYSPDPSYV